MSEQQPLIDVVAAVIQIGGRYLICQRPHHKQHGGLWEFPGGKVAQGERFYDAVIRELYEELELEVLSVGETIFCSKEFGSPFSINFLSTKVRGQPVLREHSEIRFCTIAEMKELPMAPVDRDFVLYLEAC